jgi:hypothetical protein
MTTITMSPEEWIAVDDNPIQRDTERHAAKAKHLAQYHPTHAHVSAAKLPSGRLIKLDGHTRALVWKRGDVKPPKQIEVTIYPVKSLEEAKEFYKTFDNKAALETTTDAVSGAFRALGFKPQSGLLSRGNISSALRIAWTCVYGWGAKDAAEDVYGRINEFSAEIIALDDLMLRNGRFPLGIIAAFFISYRKHDQKIVPFWVAVAGNAGEKRGREMDAVQALHELILLRKGEHGQSAQTNLCACALNAAEKWLDDEMVRATLRPIDLSTYLGRKTQKKFNLIKAA